MSLRYSLDPLLDGKGAEVRDTIATGHFYGETDRQWINSIMSYFEAGEDCFGDVSVIVQRVAGQEAIEATLYHRCESQAHGEFVGLEVEERYGLIDSGNHDRWSVEGDQLVVVKRMALPTRPPASDRRVSFGYDIALQLQRLATVIQVDLWKIDDFIDEASALLRICRRAADEVLQLAGTPWALARALTVPRSDLDDGADWPTRQGPWAFTWVAPIDFEKDRVAMFNAWRRSESLRHEPLRTLWPEQQTFVERNDPGTTQLEYSGLDLEAVPLCCDKRPLLRRLDLSGNPLRRLPDSVWLMPELQHLVVTNCPQLVLAPPLYMTEGEPLALAPIERIDVDRESIAGWEWALLTLPKLRYVSGLAGDDLESDFFVLKHDYLRDEGKCAKHLELLEVQRAHVANAPRTVRFNHGTRVTMTVVALARSFHPAELLERLSNGDGLGDSVIMSVGVAGDLQPFLQVHSDPIERAVIDAHYDWNTADIGSEDDWLMASRYDVLPFGVYPLFVSSAELDRVELVDHLINPPAPRSHTYSGLLTDWMGTGSVIEVCGEEIPWSVDHFGPMELSLAGALVVSPTGAKLQDLGDLSFDVDLWSSGDEESRERLLNRLYNCGDQPEAVDLDRLRELSPYHATRDRVAALSALARAKQDVAIGKLEMATCALCDAAADDDDDR